MPVRVRLAAASVPRFRHAGLVFGAAWAAHDLEAMAPAQRACVETYLGRFIRVHPRDEDKLRAFFHPPSGTAMMPAEVSEVVAERESEADEPVEAAAAAAELDERDDDIEREDDIERDEDANAYSGMTVAELREMATELGVDLSNSKRKADIIRALEEATS